MPMQKKRSSLTIKKNRFSKLNQIVFIQIITYSNINNFEKKCNKLSGGQYRFITNGVGECVGEGVVVVVVHKTYLTLSQTSQQLVSLKWIKFRKSLWTPYLALFLN